MGSSSLCVSLFAVVALCLCTSAERSGGPLHSGTVGEQQSSSCSRSSEESITRLLSISWILLEKALALEKKEDKSEKEVKGLSAKMAIMEIAIIGMSAKMATMENAVIGISAKMTTMENAIIGKLSMILETNAEMAVKNAEMETIKCLRKRQPAADCDDLIRRSSGQTATSVETIFRPDSKPVTVLCDQKTDGGGWTVFQQRNPVPRRVNFTRNWNEYKNGFGDVSETGEFWMGLEDLHTLLQRTDYELRIDLEDFEGEKVHALYGIFNVEGEAANYKLSIGDYSGTAGDSLINYNNGQMFTTYDRDNDESDTANCAEAYLGGWWFAKCADSNLNGYPHTGNYSKSTRSVYDGIFWYYYKNTFYSLKHTSMKIRPKHRS